jgi:flagellar protein FlgJ
MLLKRLVLIAVLVNLTFLLADFYHQRRKALARPSHVTIYVDAYQPLAREVGDRTGVPPPIILAVSALESSWGTSELARHSNNFFGMKVKEPDQARYCLQTREYLRNRPHTVRACFRAYEEPLESFRDFAHLLTTDPRYASLLKIHPKDYARWAEGLQQLGYATDPQYAKKIVWIVEQFGF